MKPLVVQKRFTTGSGPVAGQSHLMLAQGRASRGRAQRHAERTARHHPRGAAAHRDWAARVPISNRFTSWQLPRLSAGRSSGVRRSRPQRGSRARSGVSISGAATDKEQEHLAASAIGGHLRHAGVQFAVTRALGQRRARALLNTLGSRIGPTFEARPSPVVASKAVPPVNILESCGFVAVAPLWGLLASPLRSGAVRRGVGSCDGPDNTRLHLTAPREPFQMQPAVNGCSVWGIATARGLIARLPGGSASFTAG